MYIGTIGDTPENVYSNVEQLVDSFRELGLQINQAKCELIVLSDTVEERETTVSLFRGLMPEIKVVAESNASLLGAPLAEEGISSVMSVKCEELDRMVTRLRLLENHQAVALLKNCFALPKIQYILRASPVYRREEDLVSFDGSLVKALSAVTNVHSTIRRRLYHSSDITCSYGRLRNQDVKRHRTPRIYLFPSFCSGSDSKDYAKRQNSY